MDITKLKQKRNEARVAAIKARAKADRKLSDCSLSGIVERNELYRKAKTLDFIADIYDEELKRISKELLKARNLLNEVKGKSKNLRKANLLISELIQKC